jgi:hypothetical protein
MHIESDESLDEVCDSVDQLMLFSGRSYGGENSRHRTIFRKNTKYDAYFTANKDTYLNLDAKLKTKYVGLFTYFDNFSEKIYPFDNEKELIMFHVDNSTPSLQFITQCFFWASYYNLEEEKKKFWGLLQSDLNDTQLMIGLFNRNDEIYIKKLIESPKFTDVVGGFLTGCSHSDNWDLVNLFFSENIDKMTIDQGMCEAIKRHKNNVMENLVTHTTISVSQLILISVLETNVYAINYFLERNPQFQQYVLDQFMIYGTYTYGASTVKLVLNIMESMKIEEVNVGFLMEVGIFTMGLSEEDLLIKKFYDLIKLVPDLNIDHDKFMRICCEKIAQCYSLSLIDILMDMLKYLVLKQPSMINVIDEYQNQICYQFQSREGLLKAWMENFPCNVEVLQELFHRGSSHVMQNIYLLLPLCKQECDVLELIKKKLHHLIHLNHAGYGEFGNLEKFNQLHALITYSNITRNDWDEFFKSLNNCDMIDTIKRLIHLRFHEIEQLTFGDPSKMKKQDDPIYLEYQLDMDFCMRSYIYHRNTVLFWKLIYRGKYFINPDYILICGELLKYVNTDIAINIFTLRQLLKFYDYKDHCLTMFNDYSIIYKRAELQRFF